MRFQIECWVGASIVNGWLSIVRKFRLSTIDYRLSTLIFFLALSTQHLALPLQAQWKAVAPNLLGPTSIETGSIAHQSGITWAGSKRFVFMSPDSGTTWIDRSPPVSPVDAVDDIIFYDNKTGLVSTHQGNMFRTDDQGLTWKEIHRFASNNPAYSAAFLGTTDNIIVAGGGGGGYIETTHDGGRSWKTTWNPLGLSAIAVRPLLGGSAVALGGSVAAGLSILKSTDYGDTWVTMPGTTPYDSYSFAVNPCDPNYIYIAHEEGTTPIKNLSQIDVSSDEGVTWTISNSVPIDRKRGLLYYNGAIALSSKGVFVQTLGDGIHRSTDKGVTWQAIGGPTATYDTRLLCAINSNIILAADNNGTIWRTINSGGDSVTGITPFESFAITPDKLFSTDSLVSCDSPVVASIHLHGSCGRILKIIGEQIAGVDSADYKIIKTVGDSLLEDDSVFISFRPHSSGPQSGSYVITLEDGLKISIPLEGYGRNIIFVEPKAADISVDTIGGFAQVPIRFIGFPQKEDIECILHYDSRLQYNNCIALNGDPLDVPGEAWQSRVKIKIPKNDLQLDTVTGIAIFTVFPDGTDCFKVSIDSMNILSPIAPCTYAIGGPDSAMICPLKGCGIMPITNFLLHGDIPKLTIAPNPSQGEISIISSADLGEVPVEVYDMLGVKRSEKIIILKKNAPAKLELPEGNGVYQVRIKTPESIYNLRTIIKR